MLNAKQLNMLTYPDQNLKGVDSIIYSPLNVIHQVVSRASNHHCWDGTILFLCVRSNFIIELNSIEQVLNKN